MLLWDFLSRQSEVSLPRVLTIAGVSGLANALLLATVNYAANNVQQHGVRDKQFLLFVIAITLYIVTQRYILRVSTVEVEKIIARVRTDIANKIRRAELPAIEHMGRSQLFNIINTQTLTLSGSTAPMVLACQGALLVFFSAGYIFLLSRTAFFMVTAIVIAGIVFHLRTKEQVMKEMTRATVRETELGTLFNHLLEGFKEVKLSARRSNAIFEQLKLVSQEVADLKTVSGIRYADLHIFTQVLFYLLLGAVAFILPGLSDVYAQQVTQISAAILFIIGPLSLIVGVFPMFGRANHAVQNILALEQQLDSAEHGNGDGTVPAPLAFDRIRFDGVVFSYLDHDGHPTFTVGPIDLTIASGETLFIVGGNGSGKSTLLKVITGLYRPTSGRIFVDDRPVGDDEYPRYRELFSAIFSDYHLFDRPYGSDVPEGEVEAQLAEMQLTGKTSWAEGRFANQDLSTGQRKRLALVISRLEKKTIAVLDEWAADQDPDFRRYFYRELLPKMKTGATKTIIAATHDERFFKHATRVLQMDEGRLTPLDLKGIDTA
jgi:putative ATP-binding cassette transporter